ncbi:hypothetical protein G7Z17_g11000 [Cylindrodendrum hubeiense]|uniref:Uncharacterized protein n=1 Tax=Cylindrodendrum hubeiense TaxID=595255 RepID=A0A9P5H3S8_9HYPO|nr:hypothetical protein G7Z17_g11000 [Cylindrodendrum hubeiense]
MKGSRAPRDRLIIQSINHQPVPSVQSISDRKQKAAPQALPSAVPQHPWWENSPTRPGLAAPFASRLPWPPYFPTSPQHQQHQQHSTHRTHRTQAGPQEVRPTQPRLPRRYHTVPVASYWALSQTRTAASPPRFASLSSTNIPRPDSRKKTLVGASPLAPPLRTILQLEAWHPQGLIDSHHFLRSTYQDLPRTPATHSTRTVLPGVRLAATPGGGSIASDPAIDEQTKSRDKPIQSHSINYQSRQGGRLLVRSSRHPLPVLRSTPSGTLRAALLCDSATLGSPLALSGFPDGLDPSSISLHPPSRISHSTPSLRPTWGPSRKPCRRSIHCFSFRRPPSAFRLSPVSAAALTLRS